MAKYLKNASGNIAEALTVQASSGGADADKIPSLNAQGVLAASIVNSTVTSAGAGDAGKLAALDAAGKLSSTVLPPGVGADTEAIQASEALAAGAFVNIWNSAGPRVRNADAATGKEAHGFVLSATAANALATVNFEGANNVLAGRTPGATLFLSTTPGVASETAPTVAGQIVQRIGTARSATSADFSPQPPITLA